MKFNQYIILVGLLTMCIMNTAVAATANIQLQTWPQNKAVDMNPHRTIQIVNIWATWCAPCRKEMPMLSQWIQQKQRQEGNQAPEVIGIAVDSNANLNKFTQKIKVHYPLVRYVGQDSRAWMQSLGNSIGGLPFTLIRAPKCGFSQTLLGAIDSAKLDKAVAVARQQCLHKGIK